MSWKAEIMTTELCKRTRALWRPGEPQEGIACSYAWSGTIPCTGTMQCVLCGREYDKASNVAKGQ
jgi:hypothetical protein